MGKIIGDALLIFAHATVTIPLIIGVLVYFFTIDDIRGYAVLDFSKEAFERGYMVECEGYKGYFWSCQTQ